MYVCTGTSGEQGGPNRKNYYECSGQETADRIPFLSYYYTAYYNIFVFVYVSCQCHVAAFVCMYVGYICYMTNKYQRGNYYVCIYVVLGTSSGDSGFGMFMSYFFTCE